jgi:ABC-2 type transport system ATP-binding protein
MSEAAIQVSRLDKKFGSFHALRGLEFSVPVGSIYGLLGPNGAGKTTTIKILMNLLASTDGWANVLDRPSEKLTWRDFQKISYVSENQRLPEEMRVGELLAYLRPYYPAWDPALCEELLRQLDLPLDRRLKHLSRGMKMKAALLASLAFRPELIVLDEPFSGLDPVVREDFSRGLLSSVSESEWTVFLSSQDVEEVERLCDWVGIMAPGKIITSEPMDQLLRRFQRLEIVMRTDPPGPIDLGEGVLHMGRNAAILNVVHQRFAGEETLAAIRHRLPAGSSIEATPMGLREIYLALARTPEGSHS